MTSMKDLFRTNGYDRRRVVRPADDLPHSDVPNAMPARVASETTVALPVDVEPGGVAPRGLAVSHAGSQSDKWHLETGGKKALGAPAEQPSVVEGHIVHELLKGLEVSFGIEASRVENDAIANAHALAEKGLPRHDLEAGAPLEIEMALATRGAHVFSDWARRVRLRIEGTIQQEAEKLGAALVRFEQGLLRYRYLLEAVRLARSDLARAESEDERRAAEAASSPKRRVSYNRHMAKASFWLLMPLLVLADFVANVPVFNELLPTPAAAEQALRTLETNATASPLFFGLKSLAGRALVHLDASILAFSVILLLVYLGHVLGGSVRTLVALQGMETVVANDVLLHHKRRPRYPAWASTVGILLIVCVLAYARSKIEPAAAARLQQGSAQLDRIQKELAAPGISVDEVKAKDLERQRRLDEIPQLEARHQYTAAIAGMNAPIALLNIVLALCAGLAAYHFQKEDLEVEPDKAPRAVAARARLLAAQAEVASHRSFICAAVSDVDGAQRRAQHLMDSRVLRESEGKIQRLEALVRSFRAENARVRGLDTRNIKAFDALPPKLELSPDLFAAFRISDDFVRLQERYSALQQEFSKLERERQAIEEVAA